MDLNGDGVIEFRTLNEDVNYALGGASVVSFFSPLQILRYYNGALHDVTAEFPLLLEERITDWLNDSETLCSLFGGGAYLAEMAMLDRLDEGQKHIADRCMMTADEQKLIMDTLRRFGYIHKE